MKFIFVYIFPSEINIFNCTLSKVNIEIPLTHTYKNIMSMYIQNCTELNVCTHMHTSECRRCWVNLSKVRGWHQHQCPNLYNWSVVMPDADTEKNWVKGVYQNIGWNLC